jgi:hypothetical protein
VYQLAGENSDEFSYLSAPPLHSGNDKLDP